MKTFFSILLFIAFLRASQAQDRLDLLVRSEKILIQGDTTRALAAFSETLRQYPQSFAAAMRLAEINKSIGNYNRAIQYCNVAIDITDNFINSLQASLNTLGLEMDSSKRYRRFITDQATIHHLKGNIRVYQLRLEDAEREFRLSLTLDPQAIAPRLDLAKLVAESGQYDEARLLLYEALDKEPDSRQVRILLGTLYQSLNKTDSAIYHLEKAIELDSSQLHPYRLLAVMCESTDQEKAINYYSQFLAIDSSSSEIFYRRAVLYTDLGKWQQALADWTRSIDLVAHEDTYRNRGLTYFKMNKYEQAIADFDNALALHPKQPFTKINRGYANYKLGKSKQAISDLEEGLVLVPNYYMGHYFLSLAYFDLKRKRKACHALNKAISLGLNDGDIDKRLLRKCFE